MTYNLEKMTFAERVERLAGFDDLPPRFKSIRELADESGVQYDRLRRLLNEGSEPQQEDILLLADALKVSPLLLLTGKREQGMFTCEETGLYDSSIAMLQDQSKNDRYFYATKEIIDLLLRLRENTVSSDKTGRTSVTTSDLVLYMYSYLFGRIDDPDVPVVLQDGTKTMAKIDYNSPRQTLFSRFSPEQLSRIELLDELAYVRDVIRPELQGRPKTARSAPSGSADDPEPV